MCISFWLKIRSKNDNIKKQSKAILLKIKKANIQYCITWKNYNEILYKNKKLNEVHNKETSRIIPILSFKDDFIQLYCYFNINNN